MQGNSSALFVGNTIGGPYLPDYEEIEVKQIDYSIKCVACNRVVYDWEKWKKAVDNPGTEINLVCSHCLQALTTVHDDEDVTFTTTAR